MKTFELWAFLESAGGAEKWQIIEKRKSLDGALDCLFPYLLHAPDNNLYKWQIVVNEGSFNTVVFSCSIKREGGI